MEATTVADNLMESGENNIKPFTVMFEEYAGLINESLNARNVNDFLNETIAEEAGNSLFSLIIDRSQLVMTAIGLVANSATAITIIKNGKVGVSEI